MQQKPEQSSELTGLCHCAFVLVQPAQLLCRGAVALKLAHPATTAAALQKPCFVLAWTSPAQPLHACLKLKHHSWRVMRQVSVFDACCAARQRKTAGYPCATRVGRLPPAVSATTALLSTGYRVQP